MKLSPGGRVRQVPIDDRTDGRHLYLPEAVVAEIERMLPTYRGEEEHEGIIYLGGRDVDDGSIALVVLCPIATTTWGSFRTDVDANTAVVSTLGTLGMSLVGQVHSHPGEWVDHSDGDDRGALVRFVGYWSLVVPSFGRHGVRPIEQCGVHLFENGTFNRLTTHALRARVHVVPTSVDLRSAK